MPKLPILVTIPHASVFVPADIKKQMLISDFDIKNHADLYTDLLYDLKHVHVLKAKISRLIVDVNRAPDDIELESQLCVDGVVVRTTPDGKTMYRTPPTVESTNKRIEKYHATFHEEVEDLIEREGIKFLIDGHSMWSVGPSALKDSGKPRADIGLGNRDFTSCSRSKTTFIKHYFESCGYSVTVNNPYKGKFVLGYHCHRKKLPGIQIESNRRLFLNEKNLSLRKKELKKLNEVLQGLVEKIAEKFLN